MQREGRRDAISKAGGRPALRPPRDTLPPIVIGSLGQEDEEICGAKRSPRRHPTKAARPPLLASHLPPTVFRLSRPYRDSHQALAAFWPVTTRQPFDSKRPTKMQVTGHSIRPRRWQGCLLPHSGARTGGTPFLRRAGRPHYGPHVTHSPTSLSAVWVRRMKIFCEAERRSALQILPASGFLPPTYYLLSATYCSLPTASQRRALERNNELDTFHMPGL